MIPTNCESTAPDECPDCGAIWSHGECVHTGDTRAQGGYEDWRFCARCRCELFYPLLPRAAATEG